MSDNRLLDNGWSGPERIAARAALILAAVLFCIFLLYLLHPVANVVDWNVLSEIAEINTVVDSFTFSEQKFGVTVPNQLVMEQFVVSTMELGAWLGWFCLILGGLGVSLALSAISTLSRWWYLGAMTLFIVLIALSGLDILLDGNQLLTMGFAVVFSLVSYYFHAFRPDLSTLARTGFFLLLEVAFAILVGLVTKVSSPVLAAVVYLFPLWLAVSFVFLILISSELIAGFVWLSTGSRLGRGRSGWTQFLVISVLYLVSLVLIYLENTRRIPEGFNWINPAVFAIGAAIVGFLGFRQRLSAEGSLMDYRGAGFWFYAGLLITTLSFGIYAAATANDPLLEVLEDATINSQLGMGIAFLFYVFSNFYPLFKKGLAVHKVLYKPIRLDLVRVRAAGFIGILLLFSFENLIPIRQGFAAYFNGLGDLSASGSEYVIAEQYYKLALQQEFQNHKSNFALASLALKQGDETVAAFYFKQATLKKPSPQAYAGLGVVLMQENLFFDALKSMKEGVAKFPGDGHLLNNLGILYSKTNMIDSAYFYLEAAEEALSDGSVPGTNKLAMLVKLDQDQLLKEVGDKPQYSSVSYMANWFALQNKLQRFTKEDFDPKAIRGDSLLSAQGVAYVTNYSMNQAANDTAISQRALWLSDHNPFANKDLTLASVYGTYYAGDKTRALQAVSSLAEGETESSQLYKKIYGQWLLQLGMYKPAARAFQGVPGVEGGLGSAIAEAAAGDLFVAKLILRGAKEDSARLEGFLPLFEKPIKPVLLSDSLYQVALKEQGIDKWMAAVKANPYDERIVSGAFDALMKKGRNKEAYSLVVNALQLSDQSALLWERYSLSSLDTGLLEQASEGAAKVQAFAKLTDYQSFLSRYQSKRALIEKQRAEFK